MADPERTLAEGMLELSAAIEPMHDFLRGQVTYFLSQGFTPKESLGMAAAEFCTIFGSAIMRDLPPEWSP